MQNKIFINFPDEPADKWPTCLSISGVLNYFKKFIDALNDAKKENNEEKIKTFTGEIKKQVGVIISMHYDNNYYIAERKEFNEMCDEKNDIKIQLKTKKDNNHSAYEIPLGNNDKWLYLFTKIAHILPEDFDIETFYKLAAKIYYFYPIEDNYFRNSKTNNFLDDIKKYINLPGKNDSEKIFSTLYYSLLHWKFYLDLDRKELIPDDISKKDLFEKLKFVRNPNNIKNKIGNKNGIHSFYFLIGDILEKIYRVKYMDEDEIIHNKRLCILILDYLNFKSEIIYNNYYNESKFYEEIERLIIKIVLEKRFDEIKILKTYSEELIKFTFYQIISRKDVDLCHLELFVLMKKLLIKCNFTPYDFDYYIRSMQTISENIHIVAYGILTELISLDNISTVIQKNYDRYIITKLIYIMARTYYNYWGCFRLATNFKSSSIKSNHKETIEKLIEKIRTICQHSRGYIGHALFDSCNNHDREIEFYNDYIGFILN